MSTSSVPLPDYSINVIRARWQKPPARQEVEAKMVVVQRAINWYINNREDWYNKRNHDNDKEEEWTNRENYIRSIIHLSETVQLFLQGILAGFSIQTLYCDVMIIATGGNADDNENEGGEVEAFAKQYSSCLI